MERAGRVLGKLRLGRQGLSPEELARSAWETAVGKTIAARTAVAGLSDATLTIEVEDALWQRNLFGLRGMILSSLRALVGAGVVAEIRFRVGAIPRREPERAQARSTDADAAGIEDPVLRRLYRVSRKKASA